MEAWIKGITIEDVPCQYHDMINAIGLEAFLSLMQSHGGTYYYIPKADQVLRKVRDDKIKTEFRGGNYKQLAIKYGLTEITIRRIVEGNNPQLPGQVDLFQTLAETGTG